MNTKDRIRLGVPVGGQIALTSLPARMMVRKKPPSPVKMGTSGWSSAG